MCVKIISYLLIFSILLTGCYSWELVQEPEQDSTIKITTQDQQIYEMTDWQETEDFIIGDTGETKRDGRFTTMLQTRIHKREINKYEIKKIDDLNTIILIISLSAVAAGFIILDNSSFGAPFSN